MPAKHRHNRKTSPVKARAVPCLCREVVWVDSSKLRKKAIQDCQRARTTFEKAEKELEVYESVDVPAYHRWYRTQFGPLIEQGRTLQQKIHELQFRMQRVASYAGLKGCSFQESADFLERDPAGFEAEGERMWKEVKRKEEEAAQKARERAMRSLDSLVRRFENFLRMQKRSIERRLARGEDPFNVGYLLQDEFLCDQRVNSETGELFFLDPRMTEILAKYGLPNDMGDLNSMDDPHEFLEDFFERLGGEENAFAESRTPKKEHDSTRFKTLRRELAFALHPDQNGGGDPRKIELWHQVQEAIAAKDLDRLEVIHAHVQHMQGELNPGTAPVSGIRKLTEMYRQSREALRRKLRSYKKNREWNFSKISEKERQKLQEHIQYEVRSELRHWEKELHYLEEQYRAFLRPRGARRHSPFAHMAPDIDAEMDDPFDFFR